MQQRIVENNDRPNLQRSVKRETRKVNKNYSYQIKKFECWLGPKDITKENVEMYINHLKGNDYAQNSISVAVQALKWKMKQLGGDFTIDNFKKHQFKPYDFITEEEVKQLLSECYDIQTKLLLLLCYDCCLTLKEIGRLRLKDLSEDVIKTNGGYILYSPLTKLTLQAYLQENDGLSDKDKLFQVSYDQIFADLKRVNKNSGIKEINVRNLRLSRLEAINRRGFVSAVI